jgi:prepilin-type processing-associated H-X9-DG protein
MHNVHDSHGHFPSGGWGYRWAFDSPHKYGIGQNQPGSWLGSMLPYVEQQAVYDIGRDGTTAQVLQANAQRVPIPIPMFNCPSRRKGGPYFLGPNQTYFNTDPPVPTSAARCDYAANAGDQMAPQHAGPANLDLALNGPFNWLQNPAGTGVIYQRSATRILEITNGTSNVILAGERWADSAHYTTGTHGGDNESMYAGYDNDNHRTTLFPPLADIPNLPANQSLTAAIPTPQFRFGGVHPGGVNLLFCDGSVRFIEFGINTDVFKAMGRRAN